MNSNLIPSICACQEFYGCIPYRRHIRLIGHNFKKNLMFTKNLWGGYAHKKMSTDTMWVRCFLEGSEWGITWWKAENLLAESLQ